MLKYLVSGGFVVTIAAGLTGCLVDQKNVPTYYPGTANLHIAKPNESITYTVTGTRSSGTSVTPLNGRLTVTWRSYDFYPAVGPNPIPGVLQEVNTLELDNATPYGSVRYIKQDNIGNVTVYGIEAVPTGPGHKDLYLTDAAREPLPALVLKSPVTLGDTNLVSTDISDNCTTGTCSTQLARLIDQHSVVSSDNLVRTPRGKYSTYRLRYDGSLILGGGQTSFPTLMDIRAFCDTSGPVSFSGYLYIFPEAGVMQVENWCSYVPAGQPPVEYYIKATLSGTNIALPQ